MRAIYLLLTCSIFVFQSCNSNDNPAKSEYDFINGAWNLRNVSGGIAGINEDFEEGNILWLFNIESGILKIVNLASDTTYTGPKAGSYTFQIDSPTDTPILYIDNSEFGGINLVESGFIIDQNIRANGSGADGFAFKLLKHLEE